MQNIIIQTMDSTQTNQRNRHFFDLQMKPALLALLLNIVTIVGQRHLHTHVHHGVINQKTSTYDDKPKSARAGYSTYDNKPKSARAGYTNTSYDYYTNMPNSAHKLVMKK